MNELIEQQKGQVDQFQATAKRIKSDIRSDIKLDVLHRIEDSSKRTNADMKSDLRHEIETLSHSISHTALKKEAYDNRNNLVIVGLQEDANKSAQKSVADFFISTLKLKDIKFNVAYRIGSPPGPNSMYCRPILVKFPN